MLPQDVIDLYRTAKQGLQSNIKRLDFFEQPVLTEGGLYPGIWLECGPMEGLICEDYITGVAKPNHDIFFKLQREDGYLPCWIRQKEIGTAQIQMVVPIAATAWETAQKTRDHAFLERAYHACSRWDRWLTRHRNSRGTGLCEAFCEYDTGHDNSPRFFDLPKECPDADARKCAPVGKLPYLSPDLSASLFGGKIALSQMAEALGDHGAALRWKEDAETLRALIIRHCYDPEDHCFYDVDASGAFVRIKGDALLRVLGEHVVEQSMFDVIFEQHIKNPEAFWTPYPLPSIAMNDPAFVHALPDNSWGGASQALTALRASRWLDHYGKSDALGTLMLAWIDGIRRACGFMQQMNPQTGDFSTSPGYSPAMLVFLTFVDACQKRGLNLPGKPSRKAQKTYV